MIDHIGGLRQSAPRQRGLLLMYCPTEYEKALEPVLEIADAIEYRLGNDEALCPAPPGCTGKGYALTD